MISNNQESSGKAFEDLEMLGSQDPSARESLLSTMSVERKAQMVKLIAEIRNAASKQTLPDFTDKEVKETLNTAKPGEIEKRVAAERIMNMSDDDIDHLLEQVEGINKEENYKNRIKNPQQMSQILSESLGFDLNEEAVNMITKEYLAKKDIIFGTSEWPSLRRSLEDLNRNGERKMNFVTINSSISKAIVKAWQTEGNEGVPPMDMHLFN